jgi:hypothetical protein
MTSYRRDRSSVTVNGFELTQLLPQSIPVKDKLTPEFLRRLLEHNPRATLAEFCDELRIEYSLVVSPTALCRAFKQAGLDREARRQLDQLAA